MEQVKDVFSFKPFVIGGTLAGYSKVYMPDTGIKVDSKDNRLCVCVHLCDQFFTYPVTDWGIRCVPKNASCKFGGECNGCRILKNGQPTRKKGDLPSRYIRITFSSQR